MLRQLPQLKRGICGASEAGLLGRLLTLLQGSLISGKSRQGLQVSKWLALHSLRTRSQGVPGASMLAWRVMAARVGPGSLMLLKYIRFRANVRAMKRLHCQMLEPSVLKLPQPLGGL